MCIEYFDPESGRRRPWASSPQFIAANAAIAAQRHETLKAEQARRKSEREKDAELDRLAAVHNAKRRAAKAREKKLRVKGPCCYYPGAKQVFGCYALDNTMLVTYGTTPEAAYNSYIELQKSIKNWEANQ